MRGIRFAILSLLVIAADVFPLVAQQTRPPDRSEAARIILEMGVEGVKQLLERVGAPSLTFDQETQIRNLHEVLRREAERLRAEQDKDEAAFSRMLADQLFLAAVRFLNTVQRTALGAAADVNTNADLPVDENELREYLRDLTSTASQQGQGGDDDDIVIDGFSGGRMPNRDEIMEIRINDNAFTSEYSEQGRGRTEIRTRGGTGTVNGDATINFRDESLDARNAFAATRPPYQTRDFGANVSAPLIRNRLTATLGLQNDTSEEGDTLRAITPSGLIDDSITRPYRERAIALRTTTQLNEAHVLNVSYSYGDGRAENENVGGFGLPEQGARVKGSEYNFQLQETAAVSPKISHEARFRVAGEAEEIFPKSAAPYIIVPDAFRGGGSPESQNARERTLEFGNLLAYTGARSSIRTGIEGSHELEWAETRENFNGTFTFGSLDDYIARRPLQYSVNQGNPLLEVKQLNGAAFLQVDFRATPRMTMGFGARYEAQSNLRDWNNIDPRFGFAYQLGASTVLRGGTGVFHERLRVWHVQNVMRFEDQRQVSVIVRNPSYPDPFQAGTLTVRIPSSFTMRSADLAAPYSWNSEVTAETTLPFGIALTGSYRFVRGVHLFRGRNLNAPLDITSAVPRSCRPGLPDSLCRRPQPDRGNIVQMESTGLSSTHEFRLGFQRRLSFLNIRGNYRAQSAYSNVDNVLDLPADNYDMSTEWGRIEPLHGITSSVNVRMPWNVAADMIFDWNSGTPYSIVTGFDDNRDTNTTDRPAGVHRNSLTGPSFFEMSMNFSKTFILVAESAGSGPVAGGGYFGRRSGVRMTLEAEAQNVLNKVNYDRISGVITSPFFGKPIRARDGRQISVSLRFNF